MRLSNGTLLEDRLEEPPRAERILVIRLGALGDVVRTLPAVASLRAGYPGAEITWLVERKARGALEGQAGIDEILVFPREELETRWASRQLVVFVRDALRFARDLRRRRFDLVVDFHAILKSGLLSRATGAPVRATYGRPFVREGASWFATHLARIRGSRRISRFERNAALVDFLGVRPVEEVVFGVSSERREQMHEKIGAAGPVAIIHPGTSAGTPYKRYPLHHWVRVVQELNEADVHCVVAAGGDGETRIAQALVDASGGRATLAPETPEVADLAALVSACDVLLGADSGPLHLASLVGTPVVQLLGPTDPVENQPWPGTPSRSVRVGVGCSPCRSGCAAASCMSVLPPAVVALRALELLGEAAASRQRA